MSSPPCHPRGHLQSRTGTEQGRTSTEHSRAGQGAVLRCCAHRMDPQSLPGELTLLLLLWHDPVDLVGFRDVQLGPVCHLLKVGALVQGAAEPRLPRGRLGFVTLLELAFENSPGLKQRMRKKLRKSSL